MQLEVDLDFAEAGEERAELVAQIQEQLSVQIVSSLTCCLTDVVDGPAIERICLVVHGPRTRCLEERSGWC